ncbi:hypothetical protein [Actinotalea sp. K2]|uniref:hypothetical protein n=1 Tax=Actinotalea sp. K2 TaxID=2939438 RepID=UPI002017D742|nr:hypothetical protein [Actinotalea sp. K2]MCL3862184.1 hypothetical protein [Actinotalea sp. K2]
MTTSTEAGMRRSTGRRLRLTRQSSGLLLLCLAVLAALAIGLLGWSEGVVDPWLALVGGVGVGVGITFVVLDARYARRVAALRAQEPRDQR